MFSFKVITLFLTICLWEKTSAQAFSEEESLQEKLSDALETVSAQENSKLESLLEKLKGLRDKTSAQKNLEEEPPLKESIGYLEEISAQTYSKEKARWAKLHGLFPESHETSAQVNPEEESPLEESNDFWDKTSAQKNPAEESPLEESGFLDKKSAQKNPEEESPLEESGFPEDISAETIPLRAKLVAILKDVADMHGNELDNASISVNKWLKKPFIELTDRCGPENTLTGKIRSSSGEIRQIFIFLFPRENHESVDVHSMVYNLWKNLFQIVFFEVENCLDDGDVHLSAKEKLQVMAILLREIADRVSYGKLTIEDEECLREASEELRVCSLQPFEVREEPLFHVLLGDAKPDLGTCEENLAIKKCRMDGIKKCSETFQRKAKLMLSPPGGIPCENFKNW